MIHHRTLASAMLVAFGAIGGGRPAAFFALPTPNDATVTSLSVVSTSASGNGHADVVIHVEGPITLKHFVLSKPDKIVLDMSGASLGLPLGDSYDGVARGGITRIRYSQFTKSVVRVVLTLDAPHNYTVTEDHGDIHVSLEGAAEKFAPWQVGAATSTTAASTATTKAQAEPGQSRAKAEPAAAAAEPAKRAAAPAAPATPAAPAAPASAETAPPELPSLAKAEAKPSVMSTVSAKRQQQSQEPRITVNWENAPINDVLGVFSAFTGRTILPSKSVAGTVTANINNLPWDVALREVMNANGFEVTVNPDGVIFIDTFENIAARQSTVPLVTETVRLNYASASAAASMVEKRLTRSCPPTPGTGAGMPIVQPAPGSPGVLQQPVPQVGTVQSLNCPPRGAVTADTITNSISITDVPSALSDLGKYARSLDLRQPQVNIKAKIILVDRTSLEGLGLRYDLGSRQQFFNDIVPRLDSLGAARTDPGQILLGGNTVSAIANATQRIPGAALQLVYSTAMGNFDFTTFLEALQQTTLLDVQAEPSASVLNNRTANLTAGTQVPIRIIDAGTGGVAGQTSSFPRATVSFKQTGIILTVTPQITANRQVQMKVHVENSDVQFQANDVGAVYPTQKVDNEVLVADGETAVMGGLTQTSLSVTKSGLPVLVDLPIIGRLFGVTTRRETKRDLLILITPHIIDEGQVATPEAGRP